MTIVDEATNAEQVMYYAYDANGQLLTMRYGEDVYYYILNLQGDVVGITDSEGTRLISYRYEAYGSGVYVSHDVEKATLLAQISPFGYRSYVMDIGTGMYYLQSRYYDPTLGRFLNADGLVSTGQGLLSNNLFGYCKNNPTMYADRTGGVPDNILLENAQLYQQGANILMCGSYNNQADDKHKASAIYLTPSGKNVFIFAYGCKPTEMIQNCRNNIVVYDMRNNPEPQNPNMRVMNSFLIVDCNEQREILNCLADYDKKNPSIVAWGRTIDSMLFEWDIHNKFANLDDSAKDTDFDFEEEGADTAYYIRKAIRRGTERLRPFIHFILRGV